VWDIPPPLEELAPIKRVVCSTEADAAAATLKRDGVPAFAVFAFDGDPGRVDVFEHRLAVVAEVGVGLDLLDFGGAAMAATDGLKRHHPIAFHRSSPEIG
jgi:hypothetical protein